MSEPVRPLSADHAFVLQLQETGTPGSRHTGRAEHLTTGQAARFTTRAELWDFVDEVLAEVTERREQVPRKHSSDRYRARRR